MKRLIFSFLLVAGHFAIVWAQELRVTGSFHSSFDQFVSQIEAQTKIRFNYKPAWTDSLTVNLEANDEPLEEVLKRALAGTDLQYAIHGAHVFLTKERYIMTSLPVGFFASDPSSQVPTFDISAYEAEEAKRKRDNERLYTIGTKTNNLQGSATLTGVIKDARAGEDLVGASVYIEDPLIGVSTDPFGKYVIVLPKGRHVLHVKSIGMKHTQRQIMLYGSGRLDIEMEEDITPLKEVLVKSERDVRVSGLQMGVEKLDIKTMKQIPLALGETDVLKVIMTLPGVQSVGEGTSGLNVRGGATNQNLILFNDAVVFNPSHLFGFFSTFNPDVLKSVELYKSGITADYGGRLSSVLDVQAREGNMKKFTGTGGISPITGRLTLETPVIKEKASLLLGARSTYSDWILRQLDDPELQKSKASFYDFTGTYSHKLNENNQIYASGYLSNDFFRLGQDTSYSYSDKNTSLKWKHIFSPKLFASFTGALSHYSYNIASDENPANAFGLDFSIRQMESKADFSYFFNSRHTFTAGANIISYRLQPGKLSAIGKESLIIPETIEQDQGTENSVYFGDNFEVSQRMSLYFGIRYSYYRYTGPRTEFDYAPNSPREVNAIRDTLRYRSGETAGTYHGPEPRVSLRYLIDPTTSVKISYNRTRQYIQMLSNTTAITPTDIWKLSDRYIKPQVSDQVSVGYYKNLKSNTIETSLEAYYKTMNNMIDFKGGATLLLNPHLETEVVNAEGRAYGAEFLIKKASGKINGWVSYTYSRSFLRTNGSFSSETINNGKYYPSNFDKPHALNFIGNYKVNRRFNFSVNLIYSTGRPVTLPIAKYDLGGTARVFYSERNAYRIPDYFRSDVSINVEGNHKTKKLAHSSWTFAVYNATGRRNAYSVFFTSEGGVIKGYKLSVFGQAIPTVTYNFKF
ncbi:MAG: carboxypeptidase-like regulatory domain-containing protein [Bacteroidota bacterium]